MFLEEKARGEPQKPEREWPSWSSWGPEIIYFTPDPIGWPFVHCYVVLPQEDDSA